MSRKIKWRKLGGGSFSMRDGKIIKPNQIFEAAPEEIPLAFRDIVVPLEPLPQEPPLEVTPGGYIRRLLQSLWKKICENRVLSSVAAGLILALLFGIFGVSRTWIQKGWLWGQDEKEMQKQEKTIKKTDSQKSFIAKSVLPYLENLTILDNTLYIKHYYSEFVVGGKNLKKLKIAARTKKGESLEPEFSKIPPWEIYYRIYSEPYIEFEYNSNCYSIEVIMDSANTFVYTLKYISVSTMDLEPIVSK